MLFTVLCHFYVSDRVYGIMLVIVCMALC